MDPVTGPINEIVKIAVQQGGFAIIAILIFMAYRKDVKGTADVVLKVVQDNTASNVELVTLIRDMREEARRVKL